MDAKVQEVVYARWRLTQRLPLTWRLSFKGGGMLVRRITQYSYLAESTMVLDTDRASRVELHITTTISTQDPEEAKRHIFDLTGERIGELAKIVAFHKRGQEVEGAHVPHGPATHRGRDA